MTATLQTAETGAAPAPLESPMQRLPRWHATFLFAGLSVTYFVVGAVLMLRYNIFDGDGLSRVANTGYILMSRDPHLSAIGFVWNPLPSLVEIPILPLARWWPELKTHGLAGSAQSALFMAGAVLMIRRIALDRNIGTGWRWIAVGSLAANPIIVLMAGFGLSEAATVFCILWAVRYLLLWVGAMRTGDLAWAGIALGAGYLARYEALPTVCGVAVFVAAVTYLRSTQETRVQSMVLNMIIAVFPAAVAFVAWALTGWIISGDLFATLTSVYGNASQVATAHMRGGDTSFSTGNWRLIATLVLAMQPFTGIAAAVAAVIAVRTRTADSLVPVAAFGAMLAFVVWGQFTGTTFNLFRYYLPAIPMVLVIALTCWEPRIRAVGRWRFDSVGSKVGALLLCACAFIGVPVTTRSMFSTDIGVGQQFAGFASLFNGRPDADTEQYRQIGHDDRLVASYLDRKKLPAGSVLMDTFTSWLIWLASDNPKQFVVTSDYDFTIALNRPWDFGIQYFVVSNPRSSATNAIQLRYPSIWADGADVGELVYQVDGLGGQQRWRIYRIVKPEESSTTTEPQAPR